MAVRTKSKHSSEMIDSFARFWDAYPRREGRARALLKWRSMGLGPVELIQILAYLEVAVESAQWNDHSQGRNRLIPLPKTFLNERRWEDDPPPLTVNRCVRPGHPTSLCRDEGCRGPDGENLRYAHE